MLRCFRPQASKRLGLLLFACMFFVAFGYTRNATATVRVSAGINYYGETYGILAEYGNWMNVSPYGVVWCPYVDEEWAPFYDGQWIWTSYGWAWDSYEPFGELVYHYGYWYFDYDIGWFWVPGDEWSPARVQWYSYGSYCGWAPLPPPYYYWPDPWDFCDFNIWVVVHIDHFCDHHVGHHGIGHAHHRDVFPRDVCVRRAPDHHQMETIAHRQIPARTIDRRPIDIRMDRIKVADRSSGRHEVRTGERTRGSVSENRTRVTTPARNSGAERNGASVERRSSRPEREAVKPTKRSQSERRVATPRQSTPPQRQAVAPRENSRPERQAVAPRQNNQSPGQFAQRTERRQSERPVAAPRRDTQPQRHAVAPRENSRPQREAAAPRQSSQPQRHSAAPRQDSPSARRTEAPARSSQREQSRPAERNSSRSERSERPERTRAAR